MKVIGVGNKSRLKRHLICLFVVFTFLFACFAMTTSHSYAAGSSATTVKVGYFPDGDFKYKDSNGNYRGYDIEYLYEIAKYANWKYEFKEYKGFTDCYAAFKAGKVDVMSSMFYSKERAKMFDISKNDMGEIYVTVIVPNNDKKHSFNDYDSLKGIKIGILSKSIDGSAFRKWDKKNNLNSQIVSMDSSDEIYKALDDGKIDAAAITYLGNSIKYRVVAEFSPMKLYFCTLKSKPALNTQINKAMDSIAIDEPNFATNLYNKYFSFSEGQKPVFTKDEQNYINAAKTVKVAIQDDNAPFSYKNSKGDFVGVIPHLYKKISKLSGLKFSYVSANSMLSAMQMVEEGKADVVAKITDDSVTANDYNIRMTKSYMSMTITQVSRKTTTEIKTIGVPTSLKSVYSSENNVIKGVTVKYYANNKKCFNAMKHGLVDAAYLNTACANYLVNSDVSSNYIITALTGYNYSIASGTGPNSNKYLYNVINKCLRYVNPSTMDELVVKYSVGDYSSFIDLLKRVPQTVIMFFLLLLIIAIIVLSWLIHLLRRHAKAEREYAAEKEQTRKHEEALRIAERSNKEKNEFFGNISHDMRTPLNGILGYTDLALSSGSQDKIRDYLSRIKVSGNMLLNLVNDTLTMSKIENNKFVLKKHVVNNLDMIDSIVIPIEAAAEEKGIDFNVVNDLDYAFIEVDQTNLQKIFINLLTNAIKFTPKGGKVDFILEDMGETNSKGVYDTKAIVRDNGVGIDKEFLPKMFDAFAQEKPTATGNASGTGLGLAIVKRLVDLMDGTIEVKSEKNKGTEFTVCLPIKTLTDYTPETKAEIDYSKLSGVKVLICEDNDINREITSTFLEAKDIQVITASNGEEGLDIFRKSAVNEIQMIIMDIRMPIMNGYEATKSIRVLDREDAATVPIIAFTANIFPEDIKQCNEAGMNDYLSKPVEPDELYQLILNNIYK